MEEKSITSLPPLIKDDEIDLMAVGLHIWAGRKLILKTLILFFVIGLLVAFTGSEKYTSQVKLIPETGKRLGLGTLGGIASQFGFGNISSSIEEGSIPPEYFPEIIHSIPFLKSLMEFEVSIPDEQKNISLFLYFSEHRKASILSYIKAYTIGLPFTALNFLRDIFKKEEEGIEAGDGKLYRLSKEEWEVVEILKKNLSLDINRDGMIFLTVTMPEANLAAEVADQATELLSKYIHEYKTDKAREDLAFVEARFKEAADRFEQRQVQLARFRDENRGQMTALAQTEEQRILSEYELAFNVYNTLARQLEEAKLKLQEETPVIKVIEPAVVPKEKSAPRRMMILAVSIFIGILSGIGLVFGKRSLKNLKVKITKYNS